MNFHLPFAFFKPWLFVLPCIIIFVQKDVACVESQTQSEFIMNVIRQQKEIAESFLPNEVTLRAKLKDGPDVPVVQSNLSFIRLESDYFLLDKKDGNKLLKINACNSKYEFNLEKQIDEKAWRILDLKPVKKHSDTGIFVCNTSWNKFQHFLYVADTPLFWLLSQESLYTVTDFHEEQLTDQTKNTTIRLKITDPNTVYRDEKAQGYVTKIGYETAEIKFNTDKYGAIPYEYTIDQHGNSRRVVFTNFVQFDHVFVPTGLSSHVVLKNGASWDMFLGECDYKQNDGIDKSRFTLSYYGLPEPDFGNRRANGLRYLLVAIAFGMIVWALIAKTIKRRRQKLQTT